jgi:hypothetical protein
MSWMPFADPILGNKRSCDALELVVVPRVCHEGPSHHPTVTLLSNSRRLTETAVLAVANPALTDMSNFAATLGRIEVD